MARRDTVPIRTNRSQAHSNVTLVVIEQRPLRERAASEAQDLLARLEKVRDCWHHFDRKDKPAFARWRAREFGALLSRAREVEAEIRDCQNLIHQVEMEMRRGFYDPHAAYQRVTAQGHVATARDEQSPRRKNRKAVSDFEKEALFQEWIRRSLGTNPDKMDDETYTSTFETFKSHMFRAAPDNAESASHSRPAKPAAARPEPVEDEAPSPTDARVKQLYRRLVRRLHPDLRADGSAVVSALWHEVQEAYCAGDVAHLEILLALSDIETQRTGEQSLAQMRAVIAELQRSLRALEKSLREAEGEDAWDFARVGARRELHIRVERELRLDLATRSQRLALLRAVIDEWKEPSRNARISLARAESYTR